MSHEKLSEMKLSPKTLVLIVLLVLIGLIMGFWTNYWAKSKSFSSLRHLAIRSAKMNGTMVFRGRNEEEKHKLPAAEVFSSNMTDVTQRMSKELLESSENTLIRGNPYEIDTKGEQFNLGMM